MHAAALIAMKPTDCEEKRDPGKDDDRINWKMELDTYARLEKGT